MLGFSVSRGPLPTGHRYRGIRLKYEDCWDSPGYSQGCTFPTVIPGCASWRRPGISRFRARANARPGMTMDRAIRCPRRPGHPLSRACVGGSGWGLSRLRRLSRSATDGDQAALAAVVERSLLRCRVAILDAVFVKHVLHHGIGRAVIPSRIMVKVESDRGDRASADIGASPAASGGPEFNSYLLILIVRSRKL